MTAQLKRELVAAQERVVWNPAISIPAKDFEFTDPELARIKAAIQTWDSYSANADRRWLQPLVETLFGADPRQLSPCILGDSVIVIVLDAVVKGRATDPLRNLARAVREGHLPTETPRYQPTFLQT